MNRTIGFILALLAAPVFAQSSTTTGNSGTGVQIGAMAQQTVGNRTVTVTIGNNSAPKVTNVAGGGAPGTSTGSFSAGLSIGAVTGGGFGNTGGTAGSHF